MGQQKLIYLGMTIGGVLGSYVPSLLGADGFSLWMILGSVVGGLLGILGMVLLANFLGE